MGNDSAPKNETQADVKNPPETTAIALRNPDGSIRQQLKNATGQFVKQPKPLIPTIEFTRAERKKLNAVRSDKDGLTEYMVAFMNIVRIAQNEDEDPKAMMAAVKAFEVMRLSALGKPAPSEQELDKLQVQPFKIVYIPVPEIMHPEIEEYKAASDDDQPAFIDAEVVQQNKK